MDEKQEDEVECFADVRSTRTGIGLEVDLLSSLALVVLSFVGRKLEAPLRHDWLTYASPVNRWNEVCAGILTGAHNLNLCSCCYNNQSASDLTTAYALNHLHL